MPLSLEPLLAHLPVWVLVLFRITGIFILAPVFGSRSIPARVKIFLALGLSFCVYPMLLNPESTSASLLAPALTASLSLWALPSMVAMELLIGLVLGYGASLPLIGIQLGGRIVDQQVGLGLAGVLNPEFNEQTGVISEFFFMLALAVFVILGGHRILVVTLAGSFNRIPLGGFHFDAGILDLIVGLLAAMLELSLRVAAPVLCLVFLETAAMGFIARTVPQMNILSVGFALRILMGTALLIGAIGVMTGIFIDSSRQVLDQLMRLLAL